MQTQRHDLPRRHVHPGIWAWMVVAAVILFVSAVRVRLLDFPLERDEGEYAYAGQLILQGIPPYELAGTAKFPGTHLMYALFLGVFGQTASAIHLGLLLVNAASVVLVFLLGRQLLDDWAGVAAAASYALLSLSCQVLGLAAHATHFVVLPALWGLLLLPKMADSRRLVVVFAAGLCFGLALLMKQHGALFGLFGLAWLLWTEWRLRPPLTAVARASVFLVGLLLPLGLVCLWLWHVSTLSAFFFWTFSYAREYLGVQSPADGLEVLMGSLKRVMHGAAGFWGLAGAGLILLWRPGRPREGRLFLTGTATASLVAVSLGRVFRDQYFILLLPTLALLTGVTVNWLREALVTGSRRTPAMVIPTALLLAAMVNLAWTQRAPWFRLDPVQACRWVYGTNPFPEARAIGLFLRQHADPEARIAVLGSEPQVFFYARRHSATAYLYMYSFVEKHPLAARMESDMIQQLEAAPPEYLVLAFTPASWGVVPNSEMRIVQWGSQFARRHYQLIGLADTLPPVADAARGKGQPGMAVVWGAAAAAAYLAKADAGAPLPICLLQKRPTASGLDAVAPMPESSGSPAHRSN